MAKAIRHIDLTPRTVVPMEIAMNEQKVWFIRWRNEKGTWKKLGKVIKFTKVKHFVLDENNKPARSFIMVFDTSPDIVFIFPGSNSRQVPEGIELPE